MAGGRISRAVTNMLKIFDSYITENDRVAFIRFNHTSQIIFPLTLKHQAPRQLLASSIGPTGSTSFRDSLADAVEQFQSSGLDRKRWIVALTDGEDNTSKIKEDDLKNLISRVPVSLIVVGVQLGAQFKPYIESLCKLTENGAYLDVDTDTAETLEKAFTTIAKMISGHQLQLESF